MYNMYNMYNMFNMYNMYNMYKYNNNKTWLHFELCAVIIHAAKVVWYNSAQPKQGVL